MSWKTATEIPATDPWLWVRADGGLLDRRERGLHFSSHEFHHSLPAQMGAQPGKDPDSAWTTQGQDLDWQQHKSIQRLFLRNSWRNLKKWKKLNDGVCDEFETLIEMTS